MCVCVFLHKVESKVYHPLLDFTKFKGGETIYGSHFVEYFTWVPTNNCPTIVVALSEGRGGGGRDQKNCQGIVVIRENRNGINVLQASFNRELILNKSLQIICSILISKLHILISLQFHTLKSQLQSFTLTHTTLPLYTTRLISIMFWREKVLRAIYLATKSAEKETKIESDNSYFLLQ